VEVGAGFVPKSLKSETTQSVWLEPGYSGFKATTYVRLPWQKSRVFLIPTIYWDRSGKFRIAHYHPSEITARRVVRITPKRWFKRYVLSLHSKECIWPRGHLAPIRRDRYQMYRDYIICNIAQHEHKRVPPDRLGGTESQGLFSWFIDQLKDYIGLSTLSRVPCDSFRGTNPKPNRIPKLWDTGCICASEGVQCPHYRLSVIKY